MRAAAWWCRICRRLRPPPARASVAAAATESVAGGGAGGDRGRGLAVSAVPTSAGDASALEYLVPAGVRIGALAQRHELVDVDSLALAAPAPGRERMVLATVRARDAATRRDVRAALPAAAGARGPLVVAAVNDDPKGG